MHQFTNKTIRSEPTANPPPSATDKEPDAFAKEKHEQEKEAKTKGEKIFDRTLYTGINWALNLVISIAATVLLMETTRGKFMYNKQGDAINHAVKGRFGDAWKSFKTGLVEPFKPGSTHIANFDKHLTQLRMEAAANNISINSIGLERSKGHTAFEIIALCSGGNALLIPTKLIEDKKPEIVAKLEKKFDGIEEPEDHHFPKKTWGDIITARAIGFGTVVGTGFIFGKAFHALRNGTQNLAATHLPIENQRHKELASTSVGLIPVEAITCAIAAAALFIVSKTKAAFRSKKEEKRLLKEDSPHPQSTSLPTDSSTAAPVDTDKKEINFTKNVKEADNYRTMVSSTRSTDSAPAL